MKKLLYLVLTVLIVSRYWRLGC